MEQTGNGLTKVIQDTPADDQNCCLASISTETPATVFPDYR